ncbi:hypothetical protein BYT27DRAFT_6717541 [Phlegmacium glaucopus]|nr:hypothetical protein BYT27DRAFT_6717541 [Phlegmacium glaucopus]
MQSLSTFDFHRDEIAAKNKFESFKLGKGLPSSHSLNGPRHSHTRSHSRNASISAPSLSSSSSSSSSLPPLTSVTKHDMSHFSFPPGDGACVPLSLANPTPNPTPSKRNSHHRRRSSVSTRHESAELMGMTLPDLPPSASEDNINLGEKDSIRRRALWALEGKPDVSYNKVEIPELLTPDIEKMMFEYSTKPPFPSTSNSSYGNSLNPLMGSKRDSFKLLGSSSSTKDQLHTLVEEEEEEEEPVRPSKEQEVPPPVDSIKENVSPIMTTPAVAITKPPLSKPRPATLSLRPLSLTPENLGSITQGFPTPTLTPSPRPGFRSFSLNPSPSLDESSTTNTSSLEKCSPLAISLTPSSRRPILNLALDQFNSSATSIPEDDTKQTRRSSISYKRSSSNGSVTVNFAGLPTPEMTPTFPRRYSNADSVSNASDEFFPAPPTQSRPLSTSEQHFLFKSHNALLARITDLERALSVRRRESTGYPNSNGGSSRPLSVVSNMSTSDVGSGNGEPSDEMLCLITDLKAERDELKRDVDGWRTRVADLESQIGVFAKRVENERRDAWVARSRVGLLEVEKSALSKKLEAVDQLIALYDKEKALINDQRTSLKKENEEYRKKLDALETELEFVKKELKLEKSKKLTVDPLSTPIPSSLDGHFGIKKRGLGFMSLDSESSTTDVDPDSSDDNFAFSLKVVQEESSASDEDDYSEEENALAGYEDEEDTDISFQSSSSFGSEDDCPRSTQHLPQLVISPPATPKTSSAPQVFTPPRPGQESRATLSMSWTFPKGVQAQTQAVKDEDDDTVDRFFGCLDDGDSSGSSVPNSPSAYSFERSKGIFASGFKFAPADDNASFFLSDDVDLPAAAEAREERRLSAVLEEAEESDGNENEVDDSEDMFGDIGGIRITFTPAQDEPEVNEAKQLQISPVKSTSPPPTLPALNFGEEGSDEEEEAINSVIPFNFGRPLVNERQPSPPAVTFPVMMTPPPSLPRSPPSIILRSSPSIIPRPASPSSIPRPVHSRPLSSTSCLPSKPSAAPNFSSISSPSPMRVSACPSKPKTVPMSTFIRQPVRKPLTPPEATDCRKNAGSSNGSTPTPTIHPLMITPRSQPRLPTRSRK